MFVVYSLILPCILKISVKNYSGVEFTLKLFVGFLLRRSIDGRLFSKCVKETYELLHDQFPGGAKAIVNSLSGTFNKKWSYNDTGFITDSMQQILLAFESNMTVNSFEANGKIWGICRGADKVRLNSDYNIIYNAIIEAGQLNLLNIIAKVPKNAVIEGVNTDAVYFSSDAHVRELVVDGTSLETIMKQPIKLNEDEYRDYNPPRIPKREPYLFEKNVWESTLVIPESNFCCLGIGGTGKTFTCIRYALSKFKKVLGGAHKNHAVNNMRNNGLKDAFTLHRILGIKCKGEESEDSEDSDDTERCAGINHP